MLLKSVQIDHFKHVLDSTLVEIQSDITCLVGKNESGKTAIHDACCVASLIDASVFTTEKADIRVETTGRWTKGMTVCNFEKMGGMHHFGGTSAEQINFRHNIAMKLDHGKFCDLIVDAVERLTKQKG